MKYRVFGHTTVTVVVEVEAKSEQDAYQKAAAQRRCLDEYAGNGGLDKLVGVDGEDECVAADEEIEYDDIEALG